MFIQQGGNNRHEHICEALQLFADEVMEPFSSGEEAREKAKAEELAPYIEAAFTRKQYLAELADDDIPAFPAYGNTVAEVDIDSLPEAQKRRALQMRKLKEVVAEVDAQLPVSRPSSPAPR